MAPMAPIDAVNAAECVHGADGQPLVYPVPLFVRNTFIDYAALRPPSLEEFVEERRVRSCPTSLIAGEVASADEPRRQEPELRRAPLMGWWRNLLRSKTVGDASQGADGDNLRPFQAAKEGEKEQDARSECSTVDTAELSAPTSSTRELAMPTQASRHADGRIAVLQLEHSVAAPASSDVQAAMAQPESLDLPSLGSAGHDSGNCKPCAFFTSKGCKSAGSCPFCHLCEPGEKKRRQKEKRTFFSSIRKFQQFA